MPEKENRIMDKLINAFKPKKNTCEDIVCQAEMVISAYVSKRRDEIIAKYGRKKRSFSGFMIFCASGVILYLIYVALR